MLVGLDAVEWSNLRHAYGTAEDVPELLREVAFGDDAARHGTITRLCGTIWHQGDVYEATAPAVPFLVEIIVARDVIAEDTRASIGLLLTEIALDDPLLDVKFSQSAEQVEQERQWRDAARQVVSQHLPTLSVLLDEDSSAMHAVAAGVAAQLPDHASAWSSRIEQLRDGSEGPAAGLFDLAGARLAGARLSPELLDRVTAENDEAIDELHALRDYGLTLEGQTACLASLLTEQAVIQALPS